MVEGVRLSKTVVVAVEAYLRVMMGGPALLERTIAGLLEEVPTATMIEIRVIDPGTGDRGPTSG